MVSKKHTWQAFDVPQEIIEELEDMKMDKPSNIQGISLEKLTDN